MTLHVLTPSRSRPGNARRLADAIAATAAGDVQLWLGVDDDDSDLDEYLALADEGGPNGGVYVLHGPRRGLTEWTNALARRAMLGAGARWLASLGDDHLPVTLGWDKRLIEAASHPGGPGYAYPNDLLQGERMPTAWVQHADLVEALGWMMLPTCEHLCVDLAVLELGRAADRICYLADVIVEHLHPAAGKAIEDSVYAAGNSAERVHLDGTQFERWRSSAQFQADVAAVRAARWKSTQEVR